MARRQTEDADQMLLIQEEWDESDEESDSAPELLTAAKGMYKDGTAQNMKSLDDLPSDDSGSEISSSDEISESSDSSESSSLGNDEHVEGCEHEEEDHVIDIKEDDREDSWYKIEDVPIEKRLKQMRRSGFGRSAMKTRISNAKDVDTFAKEEGGEDTDKGEEETERLNTKKDTHISKHRPTEVSSKRSEFYKRSRQAGQLANSGIATEATGQINGLYRPRDPRMESMNGRFDRGAFDHNYSFLNEMHTEEIDVLKKKIAARKISGKKGRLLRKKLGITNDNLGLEEDKLLLQRLMQYQAKAKKERKEKETKHAMKQKMVDDIVAGNRKKEFYYKKKDIKRMELEAKYDELKQKRGGGVMIDKLISKRRKRNVDKDFKRFHNTKNYEQT